MAAKLVKNFPLKFNTGKLFFGILAIAYATQPNILLIVADDLGNSESINIFNVQDMAILNHSV